MVKVMFKRVFGSRAVLVAGGGLLSAILLAAGDGSLSQVEVDKITDLIKWLVTGLITKWGIEDSAHKLQLPPPTAPAAVAADLSADPTPARKANHG